MSSVIRNFPAQAPLRRCEAMRKSRIEAAKTRERIVTVATMAERVASSASRKQGRKGLEAAVADYLSTEHRDNPRDGCPLAALGSEMARADTQTRAAATAGFLKLVDALVGGFDDGTPDEA